MKVKLSALTPILVASVLAAVVVAIPLLAGGKSVCPAAKSGACPAEGSDCPAKGDGDCEGAKEAGCCPAEAEQKAAGCPLAAVAEAGWHEEHKSSCPMSKQAVYCPNKPTLAAE